MVDSQVLLSLFQAHAAQRENALRYLTRSKSGRHSDDTLPTVEGLFRLYSGEFAVLTSLTREMRAWVETDSLLTRFAPTGRRALNRGADFVRAGVGLPSVWEQLRSQVFLGPQVFLLEMQANFAGDAPLCEMSQAQRRSLRRPLASYLTQGVAGDEAMARVFRGEPCRQRDIVGFFGVPEATVNRAVRASRRLDGASA